MLFYLITRIITFIKNIFGIRNPTVEEQLETFKRLGFKLNKGVDIRSLIERWGERTGFPKNPYFFLYIVLGSTTSEDPFIPVTNQVWHFDTECIEDHGDYVKILENLKRISSGELNFKNIEDYVDIREGKVSVSFDYKGKHYSWDLNVHDDWVDEELFSKIVKLTKEHKTNGRLTYLGTGGQDMVLGWATPEQMKSIKAKTRLNIKWMK